MTCTCRFKAPKGLNSFNGKIEIERYYVTFFRPDFFLKCPAQVEGFEEAGSFFPAFFFWQLLEEENILIRSGDHLKINGCSVEIVDFTTQEIATGEALFSWEEDPEAFFARLCEVSYAAEVDSIESKKQFIYCRSTDRLLIAATDGYQLAYWQGCALGMRDELLIPAEAVRKIKKIKGKSKIIRLKWNKEWMLLEFDNQICCGIRLGQLPWFEIDYLLPSVETDNWTVKFSLSGKALWKALRELNQEKWIGVSYMDNALILEGKESEKTLTIEAQGQKRESAGLDQMVSADFQKRFLSKLANYLGTGQVEGRAYLSVNPLEKKDYMVILWLFAQKFDSQKGSVVASRRMRTA